MAKVERVRQVLSSPFGAEDIKNQTEQGWKIVAIEWEREMPEAATQPAPTGEEIEQHVDACVTFFLAAHHINHPD